MKLLHWIAARFRDLFFDPTNTSLDIGRVIGASALSFVGYAAHHNMALGKDIDLGPTGLPGGLATVLASVAYYIFKDRQQAAPKGAA